MWPVCPDWQTVYELYTCCFKPSWRLNSPVGSSGESHRVVQLLQTRDRQEVMDVDAVLNQQFDKVHSVQHQSIHHGLLQRVHLWWHHHQQCKVIRQVNRLCFSLWVIRLTEWWSDQLLVLVHRFRPSNTVKLTQCCLMCIQLQICEIILPPVRLIDNEL